MNKEQKRWIDSASYEDLLRKWRFAPAGDPWFRDDTGDYYAKVMAQKRAADPEEGVRASKSIGFER